VRRAALAVPLAVLALTGCGNDRTPVPDVSHADPPRGYRKVVLKDAGVRFTAPFNWQNLDPQGRRAGGIRSKTATLAVWRYPRSEPLPATESALEEVKGLLVDRVKARDPSFELRSSRVTRRGGADAIELVGSQEIAGLPFDVRSTHVFKAGAEVVLDAYAPPADFARVDRTVFRPVLKSLRVTAP
jgi:hypothetical protein